MAITQQKISELIEKYGIAGTCKTYASEVYSALTGTTTFGTATANAVKMLSPFAPYSDGSKQFMTFVANAEDMKKAEAVTIFASYDIDFVPSLKMELTETRNSKAWRIMGFMPLEYKGVILAYAVALQKLEGVRDTV